jgi:hypothetical protein
MQLGNFLRQKSDAAVAKAERAAWDRTATTMCKAIYGLQESAPITPWENIVANGLAMSYEEQMKFSWANPDYVKATRECGALVRECSTPLTYPPPTGSACMRCSWRNALQQIPGRWLHRARLRSRPQPPRGKSASDPRWVLRPFVRVLCRMGTAVD